MFIIEAQKSKSYCQINYLSHESHPISRSENFNFLSNQKCYDLITVLSKAKNRSQGQSQILKADQQVVPHLVERPDAAGGGVSEEAAVQHHGPAQQVEPQEHGQSQDDLQLRL